MPPRRTRWTVSARPPKGKDGPFWQLRYYPPHDAGRPGKLGKPYQRSSRLADGTAAKALAAQEEARLNAVGEGFVAIAARYVEWLEAQLAAGELAEATVRRYAQGVRVVAEQLDEVDKDTVREAQAALGRPDRGLAPRTVANHMRIARRAWRWAEENGYTRTPWPDVRPPRVKPTALRPPTPDEVALILDEARRYQGGHYYPLLATLLETGARGGETCSIRERDVDRAGCVLHFRRRWKNETARRAVPVSAALIELLPVRANPDEYVFLGVRTGRRLSSGSLTNVWNRIRLAVGLEDESLGGPHALRRAWITAARAAGVRPELSMRLCGHSDLTTHLGYARNAVDKDSQAAARKIREALPSLPHAVRPRPTVSPTGPPTESSGTCRSGLLQVGRESSKEQLTPSAVSACSRTDDPNSPEDPQTAPNQQDDPHGSPAGRVSADRYPYTKGQHKPKSRGKLR